MAGEGEELVEQRARRKKKAKLFAGGPEFQGRGGAATPNLTKIANHEYVRNSAVDTNFASVPANGIKKVYTW